jgi:hypothetical protein
VSSFRSDGNRKYYAVLQDTSKPAKGKRGNKKGERGREPTIVIVFFHITTIVGESSQKLNKIGKIFRQDVAFTSRFQESIKVLNKRQKPEKVKKKTKLFPLCGKRQKYLAKVPPF